jgi:phosphatidylglycerophosphatase C
MSGAGDSDPGVGHGIGRGAGHDAQTPQSDADVREAALAEAVREQAREAAHRYPPPAADAPLVVFDFDHTLFDGDSGSHLFKWLIWRNLWRRALALLIAPIFAPMIAWLPTRRRGISAFAWVGTLGMRDLAEFDAYAERFVATHADDIQRRLLPIGLDVLRQHREAGDRVIVATGAPAALARAILAFVAHEDLPVIGTRLGRKYGAIVAVRHCHHHMKMRMLADAGYRDPVAAAYTDSSADLPLLHAARKPVVVNPKPGRVAMFRRVLPAGTPILNWGCPGRGGDVV